MKHYTGKYLDCYDRDFYEWTIKRRLADPRDLWIQDIDALVRDRAGNLRLLEIKRNDYGPKPYQRRNIEILDAILRAGISALGGKVTIEINGRQERHEIRYHGFNLLQLSGNSFFDSKLKLDGEEISPEQLAGILSFDPERATATIERLDYEYLV